MSASERRLAAIMFTDMVGYTALGQRNESLALALVEEQSNIVRPILSRHHGREVKTIGDAFLVEFPNAIDAVRCAYDIQRTMRELAPSLDPERRIHLRVGIHVGEVVESNGDIFGDAVNLASRIEPLSEDGGVCITRQVYDQVQNKFELPLESLGPKALKNISALLEVFRVVMPWTSEELMETGAAKKRIAVLPFSNMSPDPADEFFAEGLTEDMITELSAIPGLGVVARTSVMKYKGAGKGIREIAKDLGVAAIIEGSVRKSGNKIRIVAQLINAKNEEHLWASKYDRELNDIFEVQSEIAQSIAKTLALRLVPKPEEVARPENIEAFTLCLKAHTLLHTRTRGGNDQAILLFNEALKVDPYSARANAGLADCYHVAADWRYKDFEEGESKAKEYAMKALELAPNLAEAHATLGSILYLERRNYAAAESELKTAISLNPSYAPAHQWYADLLLELGRPDEAKIETMKAMELDPFSPVIGLQLAWFYYYTGRTSEAETETTRLVRAEPGLASAYAARAYFRAQRGEKAGAKSDIEMHHNLTDDECAYLVYSATVEALVDDRNAAASHMKEALPLIEESWSPSAASPCWYYAIIGDREEFFRWVAWSTDHRAILPKSLKYDHVLLNMNSDPRYQELFKRFNLPA
ncbi:MAG TPA: adenylate/guanylate cyclase domain-containing protein [Nitrososphaerales archaeon]